MTMDHKIIYLFFWIYIIIQKVFQGDIKISNSVLRCKKKKFKHDRELFKKYHITTLPVCTKTKNIKINSIFEK